MKKSITKLLLSTVMLSSCVAAFTIPFVASPVVAHAATLSYPGGTYGMNYTKSGNNVKNIQRALNKYDGLFGNGGPIVPDGFFGIKTFYAVMSFQLREGLYPDGIVGKNTWNKMNMKIKYYYSRNFFVNIDGLF